MRGQDVKIILLAPCFDKKLEAIKVKSDSDSIIDLVISTVEIQTLFTQDISAENINERLVIDTIKIIEQIICDKME